MTRLATVRIAWIALFAALMHMLLPTVHAAVMPAGFTTYFCSTIGTTAPPPGAIDPVVPDSSSHQAMAMSCPLCAAGAHLGLTPSPHVAQPATWVLSHVLAPVPTAPAAPHPWRVHFRSRAPPAA